MSSTAPWVIQAAMHNAKKAADGGAALQEFAERTGAQNTTVRSLLARGEGGGMWSVEHVLGSLPCNVMHSTSPHDAGDAMMADDE